jgi:prophage regulatory protein
MNKQDAAPFDEGQGYPLVILRLTQVKARTGRSRSSIYADIKAGRFVAPINIGPRAVGWLAHEIDAWIAARIAESRGGAR